MSDTNNGVHVCDEMKRLKAVTGKTITVQCVSYSCNGKTIREWTSGINGRMMNRGLAACPYCERNLDEPITNQVTIE